MLPFNEAMAAGEQDLRYEYDESLALETWQDGDDITFRVRSIERDVVVINNGYCRLKPE